MRSAGLFDELLPNREDWELLFRVLPRWRVLILADVLLTKYETADSLEENHEASIESYATVLERYSERWANAPRLKARHYFNMSRACWKIGRRADARNAVISAIRLWPYSWRSWVLLFVGENIYNRLKRLRRV
jgi:hypothetical protein